jgi:ribosomal protein S18 acetylase RimI-like enzyme
MDDRIEIRAARISDSDFVGGLASSLLEFGSPAWRAPDALAPGFAEVLASAVRAHDARSTVLIAQRTDGTRLGFISLKLREDAIGVERGHVADLAVIEDARRIGVGTALMKAGETWARERGVSALSLDVWSTNEQARAFYTSLGFSVESLCLFKQLD